MIWNDTLTEINDKLANLYPEELAIRRLCTMCNINASAINFQGTAYDSWFSVLSSSHLETIKKIALQVEREKGENFEILIAELEPKRTEIVSLPEFKLNIKRHDFPPPKSYFSGREKELEDLNEAYQKNPFIFIEGAGGIGKTQFVAKFIEGLTQKDRVVWIDCNPTSQPDDVILGAGFDELLKGKEKPEREKFSAFKDKVQEFDLLVFLDNYQEVETNPNFKSMLAFFYEYLRSGHLIIIGRDNIVTPNLQPKRIPLKGLGEKSVEHARKLLEHLYPDSKGITDETLIRICHELKGYPLAIDLAVNLLSIGESEDNILNAAVDQAMVENDGNEKISERLLNAIFKRADASFEEKEFLKLISVFRGKVDKSAAQAVIPTTVYQSAWLKLVKRNLLTNEGEFFELHPLIREFSYKELDDKLGAHSLAAAYFVSKRTDKLNIDVEEKIFFHLSQTGRWTEITEFIIQFGREFITRGYLERLQTMINLVRNQGELDSFFDIFEGDIAEIKGEWDKAILCFEKAMNTANDDIRVEGIIKLGEMQYRKGHLKEAKNLFEMGMKESEEKGFVKWQARALNDLGLIHDEWGEKQTSLVFHEQSLTFRENEGDLQDIAISLINIGSVKSDLGQKKEALELYERSLKIAEEIGDKNHISMSFNTISSLKSDLGQKKEALELCEMSLKIAEEIGSKSGIAVALNSIGSIKDDLGQKMDALKLYEKSLKIKQEIGHKSGIAVCLNNIGSIKSGLGQKKEALELYERSLRIAEEIGIKSSIANYLHNIGNVKSGLGQKKEALELYERSLKIAEEIGNKSIIARYLNNIGNIKDYLGQKKEALELFERGLKIAKDIGYKETIAVFMLNIGSFLMKNNGAYKEMSSHLLCSLALYKQMEMPEFTISLNQLKKLRQNCGLENYKTYVTNAFEQLDEELKPFINMDEVFDLPKKVEKEPGRNEPCHCGSGKKYKHCHGRK